MAPLLLDRGYPHKGRLCVETKQISSTITVENRDHKPRSVTHGLGLDEFSAILAATAAPSPPNPPDRTVLLPDQSSGLGLRHESPASISRKRVAAVYEGQEYKPEIPEDMSGIQKYKDDQLLLHPGGDHYYLDESRVIPAPQEQNSFWGRVGKDITDAFGNVKNLFHDLLFGAEIRYRDESGSIQSARRKGMVGSAVDFCKDLASALTFGAWRPDGEQEPRGFLQRTGFFLSKLKEAFFGDLAQGICGSAIHMGKDLLFAGWNVLEVIPDATVGNLEQGRKLTTAVFDNGQVALDYLTDIVPFGDAWVRVHSMDLKDLKAPVLQNIQKEERSAGDLRWNYVRNTPFRKTIETVGSLLLDVLTLKILGHTKMFSDERK